MKPLSTPSIPPFLPKLPFVVPLPEMLLVPQTRHLHKPQQL
jgi:hypothetical protein